MLHFPAVQNGKCLLQSWNAMCDIPVLPEKHTLVCSIELLGQGQHPWNLSLRLYENLKASLSSQDISRPF